MDCPRPFITNISSQGKTIKNNQQRHQFNQLMIIKIFEKLKPHESKPNERVPWVKWKHYWNQPNDTDVGIIHQKKYPLAKQSPKTKQSLTIYEAWTLQMRSISVSDIHRTPTLPRHGKLN